MKIPASELTSLLRAIPPTSTLEVRDRDSGALVMSATPHEAQLLAEHGHVEGLVRKHRPDRLLALKLTVAARTAIGRLRRKLCATGRTVSEACQLISRANIPGGGVLYSHISKRTNTYGPSERRGFPTYAHLRQSSR